MRAVVHLCVHDKSATDFDTMRLGHNVVRRNSLLFALELCAGVQACWLGVPLQAEWAVREAGLELEKKMAERKQHDCKITAADNCALEVLPRTRTAMHPRSYVACAFRNSPEKHS